MGGQQLVGWQLVGQQLAGGQQLLSRLHPVARSAVIAVAVNSANDESSFKGLFMCELLVIFYGQYRVRKR